MKIITSIKQMSDISQKLQRKGKTMGFVPTMGALHQGHVSLIRRARKENNIVVVSIFVNPAQFGPPEDLKNYPRNLKRDAQMCRKEGVDFIFYPHAEDMYPGNYKTYVTVDDLSDGLCAKFRPGHFKGVTTVVTKLFNLLQPEIAYFGQKDAQQAIIIKRMTEDLNMSVKIKIMPIVRQKDGLALSSRNVYLAPKERKEALVLSQALNLADKLIKQRNRNPKDIICRMRQLINKKKSAKIQYICIVDLENLKPVERIKGKVLIALAVWIGRTRLIDNLCLNC